MQVRFSHNQQRDVRQAHALGVLDGKRRRAGYQLRWYLIVALVSSPLLWMIGRLALSSLVQEAPAQLVVASDTIRAADSGVVDSLPVQAGSTVQPGQLLVRLRNRDGELRLRQLQGLAQAGKNSSDEMEQAGALAELALQRQSIALQERTVLMYRSLQRSGGFSAADQLQAETQLNNQRLAMHELGRRLTQESYQRHGTPLDQRRAQQEHIWLDSRLRQLVHTATHAGTVTEVFVAKGDNVGAGTPLIRLQRLSTPVIWIYLQPRSGIRTWPGRQFSVQLPDGSWQAAQVQGQANLTRRTPAGLDVASRDPRLALRIPARFLSPLAARWHVDQLPLKARFRLHWP